MEKLKIDKFEKCHIKLSKSTHHFKIDVERQSLVELIRGDPINLLSHNFNPVINALNGKESLSETLCDGAI